MAAPQHPEPSAFQPFTLFNKTFFNLYDRSEIATATDKLQSQLTLFKKDDQSPASELEKLKKHYVG